MEQLNINYSINNIQNLKKNFEENNNRILEKIKVLEKEYKDMKEVLSTPNSDKIMPQLSDLIKKYDENVTKNGLYFEKVFNTILKEYNEFMMETEKSVGGEI